MVSGIHLPAQLGQHGIGPRMGALRRLRCTQRVVGSSEEVVGGCRRIVKLGEHSSGPCHGEAAGAQQRPDQPQPGGVGL